MAASKAIAEFIKGALKTGRTPNFGKLKTELERKVSAGTATKQEKEILNELKDKDIAATRAQKARQSASSRKPPVSLAGSPKVGGTQKKYGGGMNKKTNKKKGGSLGRGMGVALRGGGKVMK